MINMQNISKSNRFFYYYCPSNLYYHFIFLHFTWAIASTIGMSIAVVAVLDIHIDRKPVVSINPSISYKHNWWHLEIITLVIYLLYSINWFSFFEKNSCAKIIVPLLEILQSKPEYLRQFSNEDRNAQLPRLKSVLQGT